MSSTESNTNTNTTTNTSENKMDCTCPSLRASISSYWKRQFVRCTTYTIGVSLLGVGVYYGHKSYTNTK